MHAAGAGPERLEEYSLPSPGIRAPGQGQVEFSATLGLGKVAWQPKGALQVK